MTEDDVQPVVCDGCGTKGRTKLVGWPHAAIVNGKLCTGVMTPAEQKGK